MNKWLAAVVLSIVLSLLVSACGYMPIKQADYDALVADNAALAATKAQLEDQVDDLESRNAALEDQLTDLEAQVTDLEKKAAALRSERSNLEQRVNEHRRVLKKLVCPDSKFPGYGPNYSVVEIPVEDGEELGIVVFLTWWTTGSYQEGMPVSLIAGDLDGERSMILDLTRDCVVINPEWLDVEPLLEQGSASK